MQGIRHSKHTTGGASDSAGLPQQYVFDGTTLDLEIFLAHCSYCTVHNDSDHADDNKRISASKCVYLCQAHHLGAAGHVLWDYTSRHRLIVPSISHNTWNSFRLRPNGSRHVTNMLTFVAAEIKHITVGTHFTSLAKLQAI